MNVKQAKRELEAAYHINQNIEEKLDQIAELRTIAEKVTPVLSDMPKGGNTTSRVEDMAIKIADLEMEIFEDINTLIALKRSLYRAINGLTDREAITILEMRYLNHKTWDEIADCVHTSLRNVHNMHGRALQLFAEKYSK